MQVNFREEIPTSRRMTLRAERHLVPSVSHPMPKSTPHGPDGEAQHGVPPVAGQKFGLHEPALVHSHGPNAPPVQ